MEKKDYWSRILKYDLATKENTAQYAYPLDAVAQKPKKEGGFMVNGISSILALNEIELLVMERSFSTGYETGVFTFYDNGDATYRDAAGSMMGSWNMRDIDGGYYDQEGNWQSQRRTDMLIKLYDFRSNRILDWYFDYIDFRTSGNRLIGFVNGANYNYRYYFRKQ